MDFGLLGEMDLDPVLVEEIFHDLLGAVEGIVFELDFVIRLARIGVAVQGKEAALVFDVDALGREGREDLELGDVDVELDEEAGDVRLGEFPKSRNSANWV